MDRAVNLVFNNDDLRRLIFSYTPTKKNKKNCIYSIGDHRTVLACITILMLCTPIRLP